MALITRVSRLFQADFHAVLDRIEEPEVLLRQAVREMEEELARDEQRRIAAEPWPSDAVIRVRIGMHSGLAAPRRDNYVAIAIHQAARVVGVAHGGQIVVTDTNFIKPNASIADAIVLAVYIPPQAPGPGQLFFTMVRRTSSSIIPARYSP